MPSSLVMLMMLKAALVTSFMINVTPHYSSCKQRAQTALCMNIADQVSTELKSAMKAKEADKLTALRNIRAAFLTALKEDGTDTLPDEKALAILRKLQKQRQESIEMFARAPGREDMVDAEKAELAIIEKYLPQLADEATTTKWVEKAIADSGAASPKDMGKVMGSMTKAHKGEVDMRLVQRIATDRLKEKAG